MGVLSTAIYRVEEKQKETDMKAKRNEQRKVRFQPMKIGSETGYASYEQS